MRETDDLVIPRVSPTGEDGTLSGIIPSGRSSETLFNQKDIHMPGLLTLEPGEDTGENPSRHEDSDQTLILLAGELRAEIGDEKETMEDGDAVLVPAKTPHRFVNTGKSRATTFSVYAKPAFPPDKQSD